MIFAVSEGAEVLKLLLGRARGNKTVGSSVKSEVPSISDLLGNESNLRYCLTVLVVH